MLCGKAEDWVKKVGTVLTKNFRYEVHWYENNRNMPHNEIKVKEAEKR